MSPALRTCLIEELAVHRADAVSAEAAAVWCERMGHARTAATFREIATDARRLEDATANELAASWGV